jgi:putative membrane protein
MTEVVLTRYVHFIAVFAIVGAIFSQQFLISKSMTRAEIKRIAKIDVIYGLGALLVLAAGLTLWLWVGKPAAIYSRNWLFHSKLTLFLTLGILSIYPSIFFMKNRKGQDLDTKIDVPFTVILLLRLELILILIIPALASFASLGFGVF